MKSGFFILISLITTMCSASEYMTLERFIAATWLPHEVTCAWEPVFGDPSLINGWTNIEFANDLGECAHGQLTLTIVGKDAAGNAQRLTVKGRARIFGEAFAVQERVKIDEAVTKANLTPLMCEWSNLRATVLLDADAIAGKFAVRPLVPGRAILATDVRPRTLIRSGDSVTVLYEQSGVRVKVEGIAMADGGVGETIPVRVPEVEKNRLEGVIQNDATLRWIP